MYTISKGVVHLMYIQKNNIKSCNATSIRSETCKNERPFLVVANR